MTLSGSDLGWAARAAESAGEATRAGGSAARAAGAARSTASAISAALFLREEMGDGQEEEENPTKDIDSDHDPAVELGAQRGMTEQIVKTLRQRDEEHQQEHGPPAAQQRDDRDHDDDGDDGRRAEPGRKQVHRRPSLRSLGDDAAAGHGGNVWESNPPRTSKTPDKRI